MNTLLLLLWLWLFLLQWLLWLLLLLWRQSLGVGKVGKPQQPSVVLMLDVC